MADPNTLTAWYELLRKVFTDLRGSAYTVERARRENYRLLFDQLRVIHKDYVALFVTFRNGLIAGKGPDGIASSKDRFLEQRAQATRDREILEMEAEALAQADLPDAEREFLRAVQNYLIVQDSPTGQVGSLSGLFWHHIQQESDTNRLLQDTDQALEAISNSYKRFVARYALLDPAFRLDATESSNGEKT